MKVKRNEFFHFLLTNIPEKDKHEKICSYFFVSFNAGPTQAPTPPPVVTTKPPQPPKPTTQPTGNCKDVYPKYCPDYKKRGMCTTHVDYMTSVCPATCGFCGR